MSRVEALWNLQNVDLALGETGKRLLETRAQLGETAEMLQARQAISESEARLHQLRAQARAAELELSSLDTKIAEIDGRLYSGRVTNPKELASLQQDLQMHKHNQDHLEDGILQTMTEIEELESALESQRQALQEIEASWAASQKDLSGAAQELEAQYRALSAQRAELANSISRDDLSTYEEIRRRKGGQAVSRMQGDVCGTCRVEVPLGKRQRIRSNAELIPCDGCGRILYAG